MTELGRYMSQEVRQAMIDDINANTPPGAEPFSFKSIPEGAATSCPAAIVAQPEDVGGLYCEDCQVATIVESGGMNLRGGVRGYPLNPDRAKALWTKSEEMVGERF